MNHTMNWGHTLGAQNLIIIGASGSVGAELVSQITQLDRGINPESGILGHHHPSRILGATTSTHILLATPREVEGLVGLGEKGADIRKNIHTQGYPFVGYQEIYGTLSTLGLNPSDVIFVDMTADKSEDNLQFHKAVMDNGGSIVTANKNPISLYDGTTFQKLTSHRGRYGYSASVMAGGPAVNELQKAFDTRNTVHTIEGCFSGTLAYICSELDSGMSLSQIIKTAHKNKFTEPDPWDDLSGFDVARKILILARTAGYHSLTMKDVELQPFLPAKFSQYKGEDFFEKIIPLDAEWNQRMSQLQAEGKTLRYVAELTLVDGQPKILVGLKEVGKDTPLGTLQGTNNKVIIKTKEFTSVYEKPGAGPGNTANNVRGDIAGLLQGRRA